MSSGLKRVPTLIALAPELIVGKIALSSESTIPRRTRGFSILFKSLIVSSKIIKSDLSEVIEPKKPAAYKVKSDSVLLTLAHDLSSSQSLSDHLLRCFLICGKHSRYSDFSI